MNDLYHLRHRTRAGEGAEAQGKPRVYFASHPADLGAEDPAGAGWLSVLCGDIFKSQNCAVYYWDPDVPRPETNEDMDVLRKSRLTQDLACMQLFVIPVTGRFLRDEICFARNYEYASARANRVPILPIAVEPGLTEEFAKVMNRIEPGFGDVQVLDRTLRDPSGIPYEKKLKTFLESILVGDEMARTVRDAFDGRIFLSYRKKDRALAKKLMEEIHSVPGCEGVAVWYDEFLVPGENWSNSIEKAMDESDLVVFAVTQNLLEEKNYVKDHEFPGAMEQNKETLPVLMSETDLNALREQFPGIREPVRDDPAALSDALAPLRGEIAGRTKEYASRDSSVLKDRYLVGLSYLAAIDMERNTGRAFALILETAKAGLPVAMARLAAMYRTGDGVERSQEQSLYWAGRHADARGKAYEETGAQKEADDLFEAWWEEGDALSEAGRGEDALAVYRKMYALAAVMRERFGQSRPLAVSCSRLGSAALAREDCEEAGRWYEEALALNLERVRRAPEHLASDAELWEFGKARRDLAVSYTKLGLVLLTRREPEKALERFRQALAIQQSLAEETGSLQARRDLSVSYANIGRALLEQGYCGKALPWARESLRIDQNIQKEEPSAQAEYDLGVSRTLVMDILWELRK